MKEKKGTNIFKFLIATGMLFLLVLDILKPWTDFPLVRLHYQVSELHSTAFNLYYYLKEFAQFGFFTTISNILMVVVIFLSWGLNIKVKSSVKASCFTYMFITTIIFWTAIAPFMIWDQSIYFSFIMTYIHIFPTIIGGILIRESKLDFDIKKQTQSMLIMPVLYLAFAIIMYAITKGGSVIYPFLHFFNFFYLNLGKALSITLSIIFLIVVALIFIFTFIMSCKLLFKKNID